MKYKLSWVEKKHIDKLNKDVMECNATDENGQVVKFSIWQDFPNFENINGASEIEGNLWNKPGTDSWTLYPPKIAGVGGPRGNKGGGAIKAAEITSESVKTSQENKELGIKTSSTARMACDMVVATLANERVIDESVIKGKLEMWRKWFWMHWDDPESYPPFE